MLRVAEQYAGTDTGRQRRANEDSLLARAPLFVVADGMGGAQAGEVASRIAVESFQPGLPETSHPELELAELARPRVWRAMRVHRLPPVAWMKSVAAIARMSPVSKATARPISRAKTSAAAAVRMAAQSAVYMLAL